MEFTNNIKEEVWNRQKGMCAISGKKFEDTVDFINNQDIKFISVNPNSEIHPDYSVMVWYLSDIPHQNSSFEGNNPRLKRYYFQYANFDNYEINDLISDIKEDVDFCINLVEKNQYIKEARNFIREISQRVKSLNLDAEKYFEINSEIEKASELLKNRESEERERTKTESNEAYKDIRLKVDDEIQKIENSTNFRQARDILIKLQNEFKDISLRKEHRDELNSILYKAFDDLNKRQTEEWERYEMECSENYLNLKSRVEEATVFAENSLNFNKAREILIAAQSLFKGLRLKKEHRDELFAKIQNSFQSLNKRQDEERADFDKECAINYEKIKPIVQNAITFAENSDDYRESRDTLIAAQNAIKGLKLKKNQRDELYADIRKIFNEINKNQSEEREGFEKESTDNYSKLTNKLNELFMEMNLMNEFGIIREKLISLQGEVKLLKLKKEHRNDLFKRIREAFALFDKIRKEYRDRKKVEKNEKLTTILDSLKERNARLEESVTRDMELLNQHKEKLGSSEEEPNTDNITIEKRVEEIEARIQEKQERIKETQDRINDIMKEMEK